MERFWFFSLLCLIGGFGMVAYLTAWSSVILLWFILGLLGVLAVFPFIYEVRSSSTTDVFAPMLWLSPWFFTTYGLHAVFRTINQDWTFRGLYYGPQPPIPIFIDVVGIATLGLATLLIGYYFGGAENIADQFSPLKREWISRRAAICVSVLFFLGLIGYGSLLPAIGMGPRSTLVKGSSKYAFVLVNLVGVAAIVALSDLAAKGIERDGTEVTLRSLRRLGIGLLALLSAVWILWTLGGRGRTFRLLVVGVFLVHYLVRRFRPIEWVGLYTAIELMPSWSAAVATAMLNLDIVRLNDLIRNPYFFKKVDWFAFNNVSVLIAGVPQNLNYQYGSTFLSAIFAPLPFQPVRQGHVVFGEALAPTIIAEQIGVSLTLVGELFLNFGILGVAFGFLLAGGAIRLFYEWAVTNKSGLIGVVLYSAVANDFLMKGNFSNSAPSMGLILLPLSIALLYITKPSTDKISDYL